RERAELRLGHVARLGEARAECQNPRRLGLRVSDLGREPLRAPAELGLALPQLARVPHEVDALGGHPHLLEPRRLGSLALRGEGLARARPAPPGPTAGGPRGCGRAPGAARAAAPPAPRAGRNASGAPAPGRADG